MEVNKREQSDNSATTPPFPKRRKVALACESCRSRKTKCDGKQPVCGPCHLRGKDQQCEWDIPKTTQGNAKEYILSLENRLRDLEQDNWTRKASSQHSVDNNSTNAKNTPMAALSTNIECEPPSTSPRQAVQSQSGTSRPQEESSVMMGINVGDQKNHEYFGSSSAGSFMKQLNAAISKTDDPSTNSSNATQNKIKLSALMPQHKEMQHKTVEYVLPSRKTADHLMEIYWYFVHPLYPFMHRAETEEVCRRIWSGDDEDNNLDYCLFNILLAIACQLDERTKPEHRQAASHVYFVRSREALFYDFWDGGSLQSVQCLLLTGQYLQSTHDPQRCWMIIGMAVRLAQSLGLHLPETVARLENIREQELVKRAWFGCVMMDRLICMVLGRPGMISRANALAMLTPLSEGTEHGGDTRSTGGNGSKTPVSLTVFFERGVPLYEIMNDILIAYYSPTAKVNERNPFDMFFGTSIESKGYRSTELQQRNTTVFQLDAALDEWKQSLPPYLYPGYGPNRDSYILRRQANISWVRYLQVRILLFRPIFSTLFRSSEVCKKPAKLPFVARVAFQACTICVECAEEGLDLLHRNLPANTNENGALPAWWYTILYAYTAATILLAARLLLESFDTQSLGENISQESITESWSKANKILDFHKDHHPVARKCTSALDLMWKKLPQRFEVLQKQSTKSDKLNARNATGVSPLQHNDAQKPNNMAFTPIDTSANIASFMPASTIETLNNNYLQGLPVTSTDGNGYQQYSTANQMYQPSITPEFWNPNTSGFDNSFLANFDAWDPGDMSWLNSLPCQL